MTDLDRAARLTNRLTKLEAARETLGAETYEEMCREIEDELRRLENEPAENDAPAEAEARQTALMLAGGRSIIVGRDVTSAVIVTGDGNQINIRDAGPDQLLDAYLGSLATECGQLPLGAIDTEFVRGHGRRVSLPDVYVELDVTTTSQPSDGEQKHDWAWRLVRGASAERLGVTEALGRPESRFHVLLGDPGSGKTTLAHHLCGRLADTDTDAVPEALRGLIPLRFVLREVAASRLISGDEKGTAGLLWNALSEDLERRVGKDGAPRLFDEIRNRVLTTGGFLVLDGLDEVPESGRRILLDAVTDMVSCLRGSPSRCLVTARPYAYADPRWHLEGFEILALSPFHEEQVHQFVERWYLTAARQAFSWTSDMARGKADQLRTALANRPYLADLASRPLLLTLMATLHSSWGQLPEDRADLYEETVKLLLGRWQRARESRAGEGEAEESLSQLLQVPESRLREALEVLALTVHTKQAEDPERDARPADISEGDLLVAFKPLLGEVRPEDLVGYLEDRAGLLISRRPGLYAFPHRSFQEYLAACRLGSLPDPTQQFREHAFADPKWWREVVLLGIGRARRGGLGNAVGIVTTLLPSGPEKSPSPEEDTWQVAVLAGQALLDLRILGTDDAKLPQYEAILDRTREWLTRLVEEGRLSPKDRVEAGDVLGRLGDRRPGVGIVTTENERVPDIDWVEIPAGPFIMGSADDDPMAWDSERPQHEVDLERFWIGRYPVTNAQYRLFWESDEYEDRRFWTDAGWEWLQGTEVDVSIYPEDLQEQATDWYASRPKEKRRRPFFWNDERWGAATRPVVGVTWYEAQAYCQWLNDQEPDFGWISGVASLCVGLPTEAQWEKAARGTGAWLWPWGQDFGEGFCNSKECEIGETSVVDMFPGSRSASGVADMVGNVWEWTVTTWSRRSFSVPDYMYPYKGDGRNDVDGNSSRILRGGSWYNDKKSARCAARFGNAPGFFVAAVGFRVILSLANSEF